MDSYSEKFVKTCHELDHGHRIERLIANLANPANPCSRKAAEASLWRLLEKKAHLKDEVSYIPRLGWFSVGICKYKPGYNHMTCYKFECSHWWKIYFKKKILYKIWVVSVTRFDYNRASKSHDLLKIQGLSFVEILFVKKNPLQDLLSSLNTVISTNERHWIITGLVTFKLRYNQI